MHISKKAVVAAFISLPLLAGCVNPGTDDPNAATKHGAAGGALLGLTLGALTGEPDLAVKGAIAGGVAGGVAGAGQDIQNNRENIRHDSRNDAIAGVGNTSSSEARQPETWREIDRFIGDWSVNVQNTGVESNIGTLTAKGALKSISDAKIDIVSEQGVAIAAQFSYSEQEGYGLDVANKATDVAVSFAGERVGESQRYSFYPTRSDDVIYDGIAAADIRVDLSFVGSKVWIIESFAFIDGKEEKLQTFRFTREG